MGIKFTIALKGQLLQFYHFKRHNFFSSESTHFLSFISSITPFILTDGGTYIPISYVSTQPGPILAFCLFELMLNVPGQRQWSCRDVASILLDFYPPQKKDVMTSKNCLKYMYNQPTKPIRLVCMDGLA